MLFVFAQKKWQKKCYGYPNDNEVYVFEEFEVKDTYTEDEVMDDYEEEENEV